MTQTKWQIRAEKDPEYNELMFLRWYYFQMQAYVNQHIPWKRDNYDTFQEWIVDYYEHPRWGSNFKLKTPDEYKENARKKIYIHHSAGTDGYKENSRKRIDSK